MDDRTVLGRALEIVDAVSAFGPDLTLAELTARTGIPKPTVRRIAQDLVRRRVLDRSAGGYALGPRLAELNHSVAVQRRFAAVRPALAELHDRFGGVAWLSAGPRLAQLRRAGHVCDAELDYVVRSTWPRTGAPETLANSAVGRVVLAQRPDVVERLARRGWQQRTPYSPATVHELMPMLRQVRDMGVAFETEHCTLGWRCVAASLTDASGQPAVVGVTVPAGSTSPARMIRATLAARETIAGLLA